MQENLISKIDDLISELNKLNEDIRRISNSVNKHKKNLKEIREQICSQPSNDPPKRKPPKHKTILVVDDDPSIRDLLLSFLEDEGYDVSFAEDGLTGLEMVLKLKPHLIILDVMMPKMDGFEFCDTVYQDPLTRDIPIIMLSAKNTEDDIKTGYFVGAKGYLTKPFSQRDLLQLIRNLS